MSFPRFRPFLDWFGFHSLYPVAVLLILVAAALALQPSTDIVQTVVATTAASMVAAGVYKERNRFPRIAQAVRWFLPLAFYPMVYTSVNGMSYAAGIPSVDEALLAIDRVVFRFNPNIALGAIAQPVVTDILALAYFSYYFGMPVLLILMYRRNDEADFRLALSVMVFAWWSAFVTYTFFPALGPQRFMADQLPPLTGYLPTTAWIQGFLAAGLTPQVRDCVPSMHTGVTLLTLLFAWRYQRTFFRWYAIPGVLLIIATMYLQQHYVIDVVMGLIFGAVTYIVAERVHARRKGRVPVLAAQSKIIER